MTISPSSQDMLDKLIFAAIDPERTLCPCCSMAYVVPGTEAYRRYGVCPACNEAAKVEAQREQVRIIKLSREYDAIRQEKKRLKDRICKENETTRKR